MCPSGAVWVSGPWSAAGQDLFSPKASQRPQRPRSSHCSWVGVSAQRTGVPWTQQCHVSQSQSTHHGEAAPIPSGCRGRGGPDWKGTCPDHSTRICDWNPRILTLASVRLCTATQGSSLRMTMRAEQIVGQEPFLTSTPSGGASAQQAQSLSWPRPSTAPRGRPSSAASRQEHSQPGSSAPVPGQARHARG